MGTAKNVILFVGDGMGPTTVTSSRIYGKTEKGFLAFEKFPNIGVLKVFLKRTSLLRLQCTISNDNNDSRRIQLTS